MRVSVPAVSRRWFRIRTCRSASVCVMAARQFGAGQGRHDVGETSWPSARSRGTAQHAFERVIPQGDAPVAIEHRHALIQMVDHLATPMLLLEPVHVVGIGAIRQEQRGGDHRRDVPHPAIDHLDDAPPRRTRRAGRSGHPASARFSHDRSTGRRVTNGTTTLAIAPCAT